MTSEDTGTVAEVPAEQRRDVDDHPEDYALEGGADDELDDVYGDPGEVVDLEGEGG